MPDELSRPRIARPLPAPRSTARWSARSASDNAGAAPRHSRPRGLDAAPVFARAIDGERIDCAAGSEPRHGEHGRDIGGERLFRRLVGQLWTVGEWAVA